MLERLGGLLPDSLRRNHIGREVQVHRLLQAALQMCAERAPNAKIQGARLAHNLVFLDVAHPAIAQVLMPHATAIAQHLQQQFPAIRVTGVRFRVRP